MAKQSKKKTKIRNGRSGLLAFSAWKKCSHSFVVDYFRINISFNQEICTLQIWKSEDKKSTKAFHVCVCVCVCVSVHACVTVSSESSGCLSVALHRKGIKST